MPLPPWVPIKNGPNGQPVCDDHGQADCDECCLAWRYLTEEDSDEEDFVGDKWGPIQLPNKKWVCAAHALTTCYKCCVDYEFSTWEDEEEGEDEDEDGDEPVDEAEWQRIWTKPAIPGPKGLTCKDLPPMVPGQEQIININRFTVDGTPEELFNHAPERYRLTRFSKPREFLIYTDGACSSNGDPDAAAGWAFVFRSGQNDSRPAGFCSDRLEKKGPSGDVVRPTSNRAELRAVIAALAFRAWPGDGCQRLVIASDSEYVVKGIKQYIRKWVRNDWKTTNGKPVANRDLWETLLDKIRKLGREGQSIEFTESGRPLGIEVLFWLIPRALNQRADALAKAAALQKWVSDEYSEVFTFLPG